MSSQDSHARLALGPEDTDWYPREDGDYSSWLTMFDEKLDKYCKEPGTFENGVSVFGNGASKSLFKTMSSQSGVDSLSTAIEDESFGKYIGGKGGLIAFMVIALIVFILSITLAFSLMKCFRNKFRKCGGACHDRPRNHPRNLHGTKPTVFKYLSIFGLLAMIAVSIVCFVYSANLSYGTNSLACDFWTTMRGHFFGANNGLKASSEVSLDWKGSHPQWQVMTLLRDTVNPKPTIPENLPEGQNLPICPMCNQIMQAFNESDTSLVKVLSGSRDTVMVESFKGALLNEAIGVYLKKFAFLNLNVGSDLVLKYEGGGSSVGSAAPMKFQYGNVVPAMLKTYAEELDATTNDGIALFNQNMNVFLGRDSMMLDSSYVTADNSALSLGDVDWVMAKMIVMWDSSVWPLVSTLFKLVIAISCILGIFAFFFAAGGTAVFFKLNKHIRQESTPSPKLTTCLAVTYVILLVFSGFSFFMSSILFFAGTAGSDGCGFVEQVAFDQGNWGIFPPALLNETVTNQTDIPTVLDTCVKQTGDGDVAASLGIKMSLDKLSQSVITTEASLLATVNKQLDLEFKNLKTHSLADLTKTVGKVIHGDRPTIALSTEYANPKVDASFVITKVDQVMPWVGVGDVAHLTAMDGLFGGKNGKPLGDAMALLGYIGLWLRDLFPNAVSSEKALNVLNDLVAEANKAGFTKFNKICAKFLADAGVCTIDATTHELSGEVDVTLIDDKTTSVAPKKNPFDDIDFKEFMNVFKDATVKEANKEKLMSVVQITAALMQNDWFHRIHVTDMVKQKVSWTPNSFTEDIPADIQEVIDRLQVEVGNPPEKHIYLDAVIEEFLSNIQCTGTKANTLSASVVNKTDGTPAEAHNNKWFGLWRRLDVDLSGCTLVDLINALDVYNDNLSNTLIDAFTLANDGIMNFVVNTTIGSFEHLLTSADENLQDFNCQFVGTSMKEGVVAGLCDVVMPSVVALGLSGIFLWFFSGLGAFMTWKIYHYYRDLEVLGENFDASKLRETELPESASQMEKPVTVTKETSFHSDKQ